MEDAELFDAWRGGQASAGDRLLRRHFQGLYRFFRNKSEGAVDDLVQATMLACVRGKTQFRGECSFRTYLFVIARRVLIDHHRKRARDRLVFDPDALSVHDLEPGLQTLVGKKQEEQRLLLALRKIPLELQICLELFYWEELSSTDLARILEIPQGTVKSRIRRGRERLQEILVQDSELQHESQTSCEALDAWAAQIRDQIEMT